MNKTELVAAIAQKADVTQTVADRVLGAALESIQAAVAGGDTVALIGFGTFSQGERAARTGRNPKTGEPLNIAAAKTARFTAGKGFKDAVNKK